MSRYYVAVSLTLDLLSSLDFFFNFECLPRMDDIDNSAGSSSFQILEKRTSMATISIGRIDTLGREVI